MKNQNRPRILKSVIRICVIWIIALTPSISWAFGPGGHMIVAKIAYDRLNPKAKAQADKLLAILIDPANTTKKDKDFVNASHWPDDLRSIAQEPLKSKFAPTFSLHFIDRPFSTDGTRLPGVPTPNIVTALNDNVKILKTSTDPKAQAQALRFIIHFVGDIHQPLHCATRVDKTHPSGDRGGNDLFIDNPAKELHRYWDGGIGSFPKAGANFAPPSLSAIPPAVAKVKLGNPDTDPALKLNAPFAFQNWANESLAMAKVTAYDSLKNKDKPSAAYNAKALSAVRKRAAWAGYRLAALLNAIWH
ncbi:MAG TPA: S1/P1 nuclease [Chthoniobacterales bacterium]|jgi:hypothetical protein